jgi:hypothetical protein
MLGYCKDSVAFSQIAKISACQRSFLLGCSAPHSTLPWRWLLALRAYGSTSGGFYHRTKKKQRQMVRIKTDLAPSDNSVLTGMSISFINNQGLIVSIHLLYPVLQTPSY